MKRFAIAIPVLLLVAGMASANGGAFGAASFRSKANVRVRSSHSVQQVRVQNVCAQSFAVQSFSTVQSFAVQPVAVQAVAVAPVVQTFVQPVAVQTLVMPAVQTFAV